jgi:hypothetical protein
MMAQIGKKEEDRIPRVIGFSSVQSLSEGFIQQPFYTSQSVYLVLMKEYNESMI